MAKRKPKFAVELKATAVKAKYPTASFMAGGKSVELSEENPRYETTDEAEYLGFRDLPFLKDLGEVADDDAPEKAAD